MMMADWGRVTSVSPDLSFGCGKDNKETSSSSFNTSRRDCEGMMMGGGRGRAHEYKQG